jgi:UDP-N-acetylglucosamine--N-acetylmuramyl-(pentapeptide) pyrophosphoryl-undecaprenol N-acetylglucosamine transferase
VTGYPLRREITRWNRDAAIRHFGLDKHLQTLLVFGGSKGARSINQAIASSLSDLLNKIQIIHVTGVKNWDETEESMKRLSTDQAARYYAFPYLHDDMGAAFAAADLAVCRAGASTLGELPHFGLPAILVPIPFREHLQHVNARYLEDHQAAVVIPDGEMQNSLVNTILDLIHDQARLSAMSKSMSTLARPDAASQIADLLRSLGKKRAATK